MKNMMGLDQTYKRNRKMKQGWAKAALAGAAIAGLVSGDMPEPGKARHEVSACTRDGQMATLSYGVTVSPLFYWNGGRLVDPRLKGMFLRKLEIEIVSPLEAEWAQIVGPYTAADIQDNRARPQIEFLRASHTYTQGYGVDKIHESNVDIELIGGKLARAPDLCPVLS
jgi:hypothetical protein